MYRFKGYAKIPFPDASDRGYYFQDVDFEMVAEDREILERLLKDKFGKQAELSSIERIVEVA